MDAKKKILIVDDEKQILLMIQTRLKKNGYDVITAENGTQALERVRSEKPDLVLLDVMMPPPNGFQVCRTLKDDPDLKRIPVVLLTAKASESDRFWGAESGADAYVTKPYNPDELLGKISELLPK